MDDRYRIKKTLEDKKEHGTQKKACTKKRCKKDEDSMLHRLSMDLRDRSEPSIVSILKIDEITAMHKMDPV